jgi:hypothetical protein
VACIGLLTGGACSPGSQGDGTRIPGYATMHDTMPEAIHEAKHRAAERPEPEITRNGTAEVLASRLTRIASTGDAWLDLELARRHEGEYAAAPDTLTLLMNCNADSLIVLDAQGSALHAHVVLAPDSTLRFEQGGPRIRVYGLRPVKSGQRSETLMRLAKGGDLVVRTPVDEPPFTP